LGACESDSAFVLRTAMPCPLRQPSEAPFIVLGDMVNSKELRIHERNTGESCESNPRNWSFRIWESIPREQRFPSFMLFYHEASVDSAASSLKALQRTTSTKMIDSRGLYLWLRLYFQGNSLVIHRSSLLFDVVAESWLLDSANTTPMKVALKNIDSRKCSQ